MRRISAHCSTQINSSSWPRLDQPSQAALRAGRPPRGVSFQPAEGEEYSGGAYRLEPDVSRQSERRRPVRSGVTGWSHTVTYLRHSIYDEAVIAGVRQ